MFVSPHAVVREAVDFDNNNGVTYREVGGEHAIWAARVPFLPAMMSEDFTRLGRERIPLVMKRQFDFIYDLARARDHRATFELRFIATPNPLPGEPNLIDIVFLGKAFSARQGKGRDLALALWEKFISVFPLEDPFNYPLEPLAQADFARCYEPIPFDYLEASSILEIRKYEDMPVRPTAPLGRIERKADYVAHPFVPGQDFNPMGRFFAALAAQSEPCFAGISIRPTRMFDQEIFNVSFAIGQFKRTMVEEDDVTDEYIRSRSGIGTYVYQHLMQEREQLVTVRVYVAGRQRAPRGLAEALGSEMMGNADNVYPTQWTGALPADETEFALALDNLRYLEQDQWGHTIAPPPFARLRYLATAHEAYGAFRLPVPPESGYMPGVLVKSEPFVAPADELELRLEARANLDDVQAASAEQAREKKVGIGQVYHRGSPTSQTLWVNVRDLTRHALIAGSTGSGKSTTIKHLLSQLWRSHGVPFLVLYPIDKPDYRDLRGFSELAEELLIFTLGDESTSPFRFNPFEVPDGILLKTHLSRLMRVFMAAFNFQDPLPMIYREALRRVYRDKGWDTVTERGGPGRDYPVMVEFFETIRHIADGLEYGREVKDNVRQASVIRIGDLLENAGHVVNVRSSMPLRTIMDRPTVMEIGRVGSMQDTSLLMGFLLMRFAEELERHRRPADSPHITVVEEAHRLMADSAPTSGDPRSAAGEDFSNILAEVRGFGEGVIIAEQIPTLLVKGAIGNTYLKIMHWIEDAPSFELFANVTNLSGVQREYARTLTAGFAIVRSPFGRPVHVKVPEFEDQPGFDSEAVDNSDDGIRDYMRSQRERLGLEASPVEPWDISLAATSEGTGTTATSRDTLGLLMAAPMQTCAFCRALHETRRCRYGTTTRNRLLSDQAFIQRVDSALTESASIQEAGGRWLPITPIQEDLESRLRSLKPEDRVGIFYCLLAHRVDTAVRAPESENGGGVDRNRRLRTLLQEFDSRHVVANQET